MEKTSCPIVEKLYRFASTTVSGTGNGRQCVSTSAPCRTGKWAYRGGSCTSLRSTSLIFPTTFKYLWVFVTLVPSSPTQRLDGLRQRDPINSDKVCNGPKSGVLRGCNSVKSQREQPLEYLHLVRQRITV